ncbi:16S rRNA (cytidine1402-2'-O)-methyltransferase [Roseovarius tolerans]|uniref:Ribosomal RNA small subunit methyltransferase I n=1 Tax=Roseovarius tolerans TaxID=74031 RepID=A0A1H7ZSW0_9RHOB|nr:16S rRNA (cytidine(1402)-2'-O)-methyltransferase [Roseovarius tolerans]SEM61515.1 16S rRNA (cytidine1402-2'-O)-methyltransferase [Roseovarius tolerans]
MNPDKQKLAAGLYLIATPIGAARDITLRALDLLAAADVLVAEDTRSLRRLMDIHGLSLGDRPLWPYHDHNGARMRPRIMAALAEGKSVLYASEAGTPMVADPGFDLGRAVVAEGFDLVSAPGPSAVITALTLSGLPTDRFLFAGFLPNTSGKRKTALGELAEVPATLVFYESPKRVAAMLRDAAEVLGAGRPAALCREITKKFEEVRRGTLAELAGGCADTAPKGEIVVVVGRGDSENISEIDLDTVLREALQGGSVRDASDQVAARLRLPRRKVYQRALVLAAEHEGGEE